jgi:hypothetical protein
MNRLAGLARLFLDFMEDRRIKSLVSECVIFASLELAAF